jgi:predicted porin
MKWHMKCIKKMFWAAVCMSLFFSTAIAQQAVTVVGTVNAAGQIEGQDGKIAEIAVDEKGSRLLQMVGKKVNVTGTVDEKDGTRIITVQEFQVSEK